MLPNSRHILNVSPSVLCFFLLESQNIFDYKYLRMCNSVKFFFFFNITPQHCGLIFLFKYLFEIGKELLSLAHYPKAWGCCNQSRLMLRAQNSVWVSHVGGKNPIYLGHHHCLSAFKLVDSRSGSWSQALNPGTPMRDTDISISDFTSRPAADPMA